MVANSSHRLISDADGKKHAQRESLEDCIVSEIQFEAGHNTTVVEIRSRDKKVTFSQQFCPNTTTSIKRARIRQVVALSCYSSYEDFRTVDNTQTPHPSGAPIYIFKSKEGIFPQISCTLMTREY